jgi:hypothetical protein
MQRLARDQTEPANELEWLPPDLGFERITLEAGVAYAMDAVQKTMATTGPHEASPGGALAQLIDRLSQRLPVSRLASAESH